MKNVWMLLLITICFAGCSTTPDAPVSPPPFSVEIVVKPTPETQQVLRFAAPELRIKLR